MSVKKLTTEFSDEKYINNLVIGEKGFGKNAAVQQDSIPEAILKAMDHLENLAVTNNFVVKNMI